MLKNLHTYVLFYKSENLATPDLYSGMATGGAKAQLPHSDVNQNLHHSPWSLQHVRLHGHEQVRLSGSWHLSSSIWYGSLIHMSGMTL